MKKAIIFSILLLGTTSIFAATTMCYKEGSSMKTVENTPLDGGECGGQFSLKDMKNKGWIVDDIKISQTAKGMDFIYVLKTPTPISTQTVVGTGVAGVAVGTQLTSDQQAKMEANILAKLEQNKKAEEKAKVEETLKEEKVSAENMYVDKCQSCHGANGEVSRISGTRALNTLSIEDMEEAYKDYALGRNGKESSINGPFHIGNLSYKTIEGVYLYLQEINNPQPNQNNTSDNSQTQK